MSGIIVLLNTKHWIKISQILVSLWDKIFYDKIFSFFILTNYTGHLRGCGGVELHPTVKFASAASWEHFCIILRKLILKHYGLKILNIFCVKKGLHSFHIFPTEILKTSNKTKNTRFLHSFLLFTTSIYQALLVTTDSRLGSSLTNTSFLIGWKLVFLSQSFS